MAKFFEFSGSKKERGAAKAEPPMKKEEDIRIDLDQDKAVWLKNRISELAKTKPELFSDDNMIDDQMKAVSRYSDFELIMKINDCTESSVMEEPYKYLAMKYVSINRGIMPDATQK